MLKIFKEIPALEENFVSSIIDGLNAEPKTLPSKFFYDEIGDGLFQQIMRLPEYYPTACETEILNKHKIELCNLFSANGKSFKLIELGAGDGQKTRILIDCFRNNDCNFTYVPVDISSHVLELITERFAVEFPGLPQKPMVCDYFEALQKIKDEKTPKVILFLGANIGNFTSHEAAGFLSRLAERMSKDDVFLCGFDLRKDPRIIYRAYNDSKGVTRDFNFNLLHRINKELDADFLDENFIHYPVYEPDSGEMKSFLVSTCAHSVKLRRVNKTIKFKCWESMFTEVSCKYNVEEIRQLAESSGLYVDRVFTDSKDYFADILLRKK